MDHGAEDDAPEALDALVASLFDRVAARMALAIEQLETGRPAEVRAAERAVLELRRALWLLVDERTRVDRLRSKIAGLVGNEGGGRLDLDAARDEIGRRLAGLRAAGGGR
jgi:hypothetical protein